MHGLLKIIQTLLIFIKNGFVLEAKLEEFKLIGEDYLGVNIFALKNAPK